MSFVQLEPANGPACPYCGCRDARILKHPPEGVTTWWEQGRARCNHCGAAFAFRELPPPVGEAADETAVEAEFESAEIELPESVKVPARDTAYPVRECPECGSPNTRVKSSPKAPPDQSKIRYHECKDCPAKFKSVDRRHLKTSLRGVS